MKIPYNNKTMFTLLSNLIPCTQIHTSYIIISAQKKNFNPMLKGKLIIFYQYGKMHHEIIGSLYHVCWLKKSQRTNKKKLKTQTMGIYDDVPYQIIYHLLFNQNNFIMMVTIHCSTIKNKNKGYENAQTSYIHATTTTTLPWNI